MLPHSKSYLVSGGFSPQAASFLLIGLFMAGVVGIQIISRILHHFIPSHVVDCDHNHDDDEGEEDHHHHHHYTHNHAGEMSEHDHNDEIRQSLVVKIQGPEESENTPLLSRRRTSSPPKKRTTSNPEQTSQSLTANGFVTAPSSRRPSMLPKSLSRTFTRLAGNQKSNCDQNGPCMGYSDPCGLDCLREKTKRGSIMQISRSNTWRSRPNLEFTPVLVEYDEEEGISPAYERTRAARRTSQGETFRGRSRSSTRHHHHPEQDRASRKQSRDASVSAGSTKEHHHHVPTNAFLSIGLQTSMAIALHKAPEGFITYATNHANPKLGFSVFMALFIHNITEGYAMSLPLYLALQSRWKAMIWSSLLGGVSQPVGAAVAALWFKFASTPPGEGVYGGMVAVTSGIMTSVALSLFSESLSLSHNKNICIAFAFLGMAILGISSALTA